MSNWYTNGMVLIGLGGGLLAGHLFSRASFGQGNDIPLPYNVGRAIFGGLSMVLVYTFLGRRQQG